jgi:DNA-binding NarL/FixJ family response regulator
VLEEDPHTPVDDLAMRAAARFTAGDFTAAALFSGEALDLARASGDLDDVRTALCITIITATAIEWTSSAQEAIDELRALPPGDRLDRFFAAEASLAIGDLVVALDTLTVHGMLPPPDHAEQGVPVVAVLQLARVFLFQGRPADALPYLDAARDMAIRQDDVLWQRLIESVRVFAGAQSGEPVRIDPPERASRDVAGFLTDARLAFFAYAAAGTGDLAEAERILRLLDAPAFATLQIADRALAIDILVQSALARGDVDGAAGLAAGLLPIAAHPVAGAVVEQVFARVDLARGDVTTSIQRAEIAAARSVLAGRYREAASLRLLRARALARTGQRAAARDEFSALLLRLDAGGDAGITTQLRRAMRELGLRPRPALGAGWEALTDREREVAVFVARGMPNRTIAQSLFLSERTVEGYVSRVLHVLGSPTRAGLPSRVPDDEDAAAREPLTARQQQTATLVAHGMTNAEIAAELGVSVKTVEKHVSDVLDRWGLQSRTQIARALR